MKKNEGTHIWANTSLINIVMKKNSQDYQRHKIYREYLVL